ncbi:hypothetical protein ACLB2K_040231 [Fragaria x ananassa]
MDRPCDICAGFTDRGIAFEEVIVTCSKCRVSRQHIYCMRVNLSLDEDWDPDNWVCESCEEGNGMLFPNSRIKEDTLESLTDRSRYDAMHLAGPSTSNCSGWQAHSTRQKPVVSGKVKFITNEEVRRLSSADQPQVIPVGYKTVAPKSPGSGVKVNPRFIRSEVAMPHRRSRPPKMQSISKINQQVSQNFKHSQDAETSKEETAIGKKLSTVATLRHFSPISTPEKRAPGTPTKWHIIEEQPIDASLHSQGVESPKRITVEEPTKFSCTPSTSRHSQFKMSYGGNTSKAEHNHSDGRQRDPLNMIPSVHSYHSPALHPIWKGGFIILDSETPAQFIGGFQAQPPSTVHRKAYEFSRKMPPVLRANLIPRLLLWADPFQEECPDLQDVGLYFFPDDNIAGSRETYALLFEVMDTQNSVMRIYFDGVDAVDLLIFTSTQLHFYSPNTVTSPRGKMVGTVDVVVPKDSSTLYREPIMEALQQLLNIKKDEHYSYLTRLRVLDSTVKLLLEFNLEERPVKDEHSASADMKTTCPVQVKLEKDAAEACLETYKKPLTSLPCFPEPSPQSGADSTDEIVGATSTLDEIAILRMLCNIDKSRTRSPVEKLSFTLLFVQRVREEEMASELVLTFAAEGILTTVSSLAANKIALAWGFHTELEKLRQSLSNIQDFLGSAADQRLDDRGKAVEKWVKKLKQEAEDADDVLDEFEYELLRQQVELRNHMKRRDEAVRNKVTTLISSDNQQKNLSVMAIVGMAGLGKTTLAKSVYN